MHQAGKASKYTRSRLPVKIVYFEKHLTQTWAMRREIEIKSFSRKKKLVLLKKEMRV
jgi:putative endonuclease